MNISLANKKSGVEKTKIYHDLAIIYNPPKPSIIDTRKTPNSLHISLLSDVASNRLAQKGEDLREIGRILIPESVSNKLPGQNRYFPFSNDNSA